LYPFFEKVYGSEFDGTRTDKGQLIAYLLETEGIKVKSSLMVGDRMHDIRAARQNKMASAGVTYGFGSVEELVTAGADYLVGGLKELPALIQGED
jgi:phosphoglycolate phosphatase